MFDTEKFIIEIQNNACLWDSTDAYYNSRLTRREAWKDIARIFNDEWESFSKRKQREVGMYLYACIKL